MREEILAASYKHELLLRDVQESEAKLEKMQSEKRRQDGAPFGYNYDPHRDKWIDKDGTIWES